MTGDAPDDEETRLGQGAEVGGYVVDGILGVGGMGVVYAATHPIIGKRAAIKVLRPELSSEPSAVERFVTEARSVNQIGHPNIVDIFGFGALADGRSYYVMDLLAGESLRARLKRSGALHISEAACAIDETASALMAAHAKGIIHRDLKPDNVFMVSAPGRWPEVKLLDWGLAKLMSPTNKFRTLTGSVLGTPVYMSPEQARAADSVDFRTDIYALGVMSYELLAGDVPFRKRTTLDTIIAHQEDRPPPLGERVPGLPEELVQLIDAMLAKSADDRPTLAAVRTVLKRLKGNKIPTMTAAGLEMTLPPVTVLGEHDGEQTVDEKMSMQRTAPLVPSQELRTRPPPRMGPPELASIAPLPPPPEAPPHPPPAPIAPVSSSHAEGSIPPSHPGVLPAGDKSRPSIEPHSPSGVLPAGDKPRPSIEPHSPSGVLPAGDKPRPSIEPHSPSGVLPAGGKPRPSIEPHSPSGVLPAGGKPRPSIEPHSPSGMLPAGGPSSRRWIPLLIVAIVIVAIVIAIVLWTVSTGA